MKFVSCFVDETGQQDMRAGYYMLTLVFHDQAKTITTMLESYAERLAYESLPDIPFHAVDLLHGHGEYEHLSVETRKRLLIVFSMLVRTLPISYHTFCYDASTVGTKEELLQSMRKDLVNFLFDHLSKFQQYDRVPIYYDGGHQAVTEALHEAFDYALAKNVAIYKDLSHQDKRLAQTADYLCTIELAAMRYKQGAESPTYLRFFGSPRNFKQNFLKQVRRKRQADQQCDFCPCVFTGYVPLLPLHRNSFRHTSWMMAHDERVKSCPLHIQARRPCARRPAAGSFRFQGSDLRPIPSAHRPR